MIGEKLKLARKNKHLTISQLEKITGISTSFISDIENNKKSPTSNIIIELCKALEISADWLLLDKENITDNKKETELLEIYRLLSEDNKAVGKYKLKELLKEQENEKNYTKNGNL
jgi:transcriptional regulator with XRE-family HTH domain